MGELRRVARIVRDDREERFVATVDRMRWRRKPIRFGLEAGRLIPPTPGGSRGGMKFTLHDQERFAELSSDWKIIR